MPKNPNSGLRNAPRQRVMPDDEHTTAIQLSFRSYASELDSKHDRHERIVKLSRDITIESKRIIFLLHSIDANKKVKVLKEAEQRLTKLIQVNFRAVAAELRGQDVYQFRAAYSPGLQEFIEAYTYMEYLRSEDCTDSDSSQKPMSDWIALQSVMQYEDDINKEDTVQDKVDEATIESPAAETTENKYEFFVDPTEYILGVSDLTGELMRRCINSLGSGETNTCVETCRALQHIYTGYISLNCPRARELWRKITVMRQSLIKVENVCYNVKVRGGEAAKWGAVFDQKPTSFVDEGFY